MVVRAVKYRDDSVKNSVKMASLSTSSSWWHHGHPQAPDSIMEENIMNGRRWNFVASARLMTIGFFVIFLSLLAVAVSETSVKSKPEALHPTNGELNFQQQSSSSPSHTTSSIGYVAEWEYEGVTSPALDEVEESFGTEQVSPLRQSQSGDLENEDGSGSGVYPSRRLGPGTWQDSRGSWWLFGGQGPSISTTTTDKSIHYLSDLWLYEREKQAWRLVFRPQSETSPIHSSYPENLAFPHVCGSETNGHIAVFGGGGITGTTTNMKTSRKGNPSLPFTDDNVVWLFDVPINKTNGGHAIQLDPDWDESSGLWTSYICCDACLPDGNTSLEFCPRFSREPVLWCGQDSLMALQLSHNVADWTRREKESGGPLNEGINGSTSEEGDRDSNAAEVKSSLRRNLPEEIIPFDIHPTSLSATTDDDDNNNNHAHASNTSSGNGHIQTNRINSPSSKLNSLRATWWKFDLAATEWEKMPQVNVTQAAADLIEGGDCRTVSDQHMVYILCPSPGNPLERSVLLFDPTTATIDLLPGSRMELNNAFRDSHVWQLGRSTLKAIRTDKRMTVLFLAYHKLLDLWIHDHSSNRLYPVENVWKGSSLHAFQLSPSFYKITISFPTSTYGDNDDTSTKNNKQNNTTTNDRNTNYTFYMENPRSKLFQFFDHEQKDNGEKHDSWTSTGRFHISIVTDKLVFLPSRDASFLINQDTHTLLTSKQTTQPPSESTSSSPQNNHTLNPTQIQQAEQIESTSSSTSLPLASQTKPVTTSTKTLIMTSTSPSPVVSSSPSSHVSTSAEQKLTMSTMAPNPSTTGSPSKFNISQETTAATSQPIAMRDTSSTTQQFTLNNRDEDVRGNLTDGRSRTTIDPVTQVGLNNATARLRLNMSNPGVTSIMASEAPVTHSTSSTPMLASTIQAAHLAGASAKAVGSKPLVITSSTKRIPKGIVKVVNGKMGDSGKAVNLHGVKRVAAAALIFEKNKSGQAPASGTTGKPKEIAVAPPVHHQDDDDEHDHLLHESLRTNRVHPRWNSSSKQEEQVGPKEPSPSLRSTSSKLNQLSQDSFHVTTMSVNEELHVDSISSDPLLILDDGARAAMDSDDAEGEKAHRGSEAQSYGSSEMALETLTAIKSMNEGPGMSASYSSMLFFAVSLSIFAIFGIVLFVRRCVKCPPRVDDSVLIKEPPPIRYSVIPDELSYHTPIV